MKAAIDMVGGNIPSSEYSHNASWAHLRANQLRCLGIDVDVIDSSNKPLDWSEYDTIFIYHGINFHEAEQGKQSLNLFGGTTESNAKQYEKLGNPKHDHIIYLSLDHKMPDYGQLCKSRKAEPSSYWGSIDWDKVSARCQHVEHVRDPFLYFEQAPVWQRRLTMGDSHAHSVYQAGSMVLRKDGRTMNGVLKKTLQKEIADGGFNIDNISSLTCYYGNIDIRHHLCREPDPKAATKELLKRYEAQLQSLNRPIELVTPIPIEDESRKLPGTGFYKGTPFFGSRAERMELVDRFKDELHEMTIRNVGWSLFSWPDAWYKMDGVEFFKYQEKPKSVHLGWKHYRWDLRNNVPNPEHVKMSAPTQNLLEF